MTSTTDRARQSEEVGELVARLAKITAAVGYVQHGGKVDFGRTKYSYATQADLIAAVREHLATHQVAVTTSVLEVTPMGKDWYVAVEYTLRHGDQWIACACPGYGQGDKGLYAAITGSQKYWLRTTFLIATGDDPEEYDNQRATQGSASRETPQRQPQQAMPNYDRMVEQPRQSKGSELTPEQRLIVRAAEGAASRLVELRAFESYDDALSAIRMKALAKAGGDSSAITTNHVLEASADLAEKRNR
jgi:hypothetical protein